MRVPAVLRIVVLAALLLIPMLARAQDASLTGVWLTYRDRFVGDDGRVRDTGNKDVSHTEGQGWAMLFAEAFDDRASFDRIWHWTRDTLQRPDSALFAWRWDPNDKNPIADTNNATDGDMLIAWALERAARRWHAAEYHEAARRIVVDIREKLITRVAGRLVLLPGANGFTQKDGTVIVNPSYYIYPALAEFPQLDGSAEWGRLRRDGLGLLTKARFGQWGLPTDWIAVDKTGNVSPAAALPPRFGFDAIRIPLYLIWGREATSQRLAALIKFWNGFGDKPVPAWIDVTSGATAPFPAPNGFQAIIDLTRSRFRTKTPPLPQISDSDDYYSASLILLSGLARDAIGR
jgi:endo-1,4-beta-D-glucanase Y